MKDTAYSLPMVTNGRGELHHRYGHRVHLMANPLALTWLARLGNSSCVQPEVNRLTTQLYRLLIQEVINRELPLTERRIETRMSQYAGEDGFYEGAAVDPSTEVTTVDLIRAGVLPSMVCFEALCEVLNPAGVRQDHLLMNRKTNDEGQVIGSDLSGSKIAGPVHGRTILFPDPMGATGGSLAEAIRFYLTQLDGPPKRFISLNLIVTPEFIRLMHKEFGDKISIYAIRLDRGLSLEDVLQTMPGLNWDRECGLNEHQYIVPGAGGMGEIMNNELT